MCNPCRRGRASRGGTIPRMKPSNGILLACAFAATFAAPQAFADAWGTMSPDQYEAAQERIEAQRKADDRACRQLKDQARDVCAAQAKGRERSALAALEAEYRPGPDAQRDAKEAKAEADYAVARVRCKGVAKEARDRCVDRARHALEAAIRQAKVEKVEQENALAREKKKEERAKAAARAAQQGQNAS